MRHVKNLSWFALSLFAFGAIGGGVPMQAPPSPLYVTNRSAAALAGALNGQPFVTRNQSILPVDAQDGKYYHYGTGAANPLATSFVTGLLPVQPGHSYIATIPLNQRGPAISTFFRSDWLCWDANSNYLGTIIYEAPQYTWATNQVTSGRMSDDTYEGFYLIISPTSKVHFVGCALPYQYATHSTKDFTRWLSHLRFCEGTNLTGAPKPPANFRIAFAGDSLTAPLSGGWTTNLMAEPSMTDWASTNVAVSGYRTAWIATNLYNVTNWLAKATTNDQAIGWVFGGYNDISYGTNLVDTEANLAAMWGAVTNVGATPIVATVWRKTTDDPTSFNLLNGWIRSNYTAYGAILVDLAKVIDPAQGMTFDGLHPGALGNQYITRAVLDAIRTRQRVAIPQTVGTNGTWFGTQAPCAIYLGANGKTNLLLQTDGSLQLFSPTGGIFKLNVDDAGSLTTTRVY